MPVSGGSRFENWGDLVDSIIYEYIIANGIMNRWDEVDVEGLFHEIGNPAKGERDRWTKGSLDQKPTISVQKTSSESACRRCALPPIETPHDICR